MKEPGGQKTMSSVDNFPTEEIIKKIKTLGFREEDIKDAIDLLKRDTPFSKALLEQGDPEHGCLELLLLLVPESRLPKHFLSRNTSTPAMTMKGYPPYSTCRTYHRLRKTSLSL